MIYLEGHTPDGFPMYAECEFCGESDIWRADISSPPQELMEQLKAYIRLHDRKRVVPPPATLGAYSPRSRRRRGTI